MADIGASILARLKNKAVASGRSFQLCLQLFCQEEFLRRLEKSRYAENLVLKGGLFIYALTEFDSRVTSDVDFLLRKIPNTPEQLRLVLEEIISVDTGNDFISFEIKNIAPISLQKRYTGIGASLVGRIKNTHTPFGIDFGIGDIIIPKQKKRSIPTQLDGFSVPTVNTYSLETTVAEKLDAILALMEFSSRMKDYYDICYLASKFDFDGQILSTAFMIHNGDLIIDFPSCLIKPRADMTPAEKGKAKNTIQILHLNDEDQASQRFEIVMAYINGDISKQFLEAKYPFIASELQRQCLYEKIKDMIKFLS